MQTEEVRDIFSTHFSQHSVDGAKGIVISMAEQASMINSASGARICRTCKPLAQLVNEEMAGDWRDMLTRILIQFGDRSVSELNSVFLVFEGLSIYDACYLTNRRLTSLLQESTRAIDMDDVAFDGDVIKSRRWMEFYKKCKPLLKKRIKDKFPRAPDVEVPAYLAAVKYLAFDYCREFLPLGLRTRVALSINVRQLISNIHKWGNEFNPAPIRTVAAILKKMVSEKMPYLLGALEPQRNPKPWYTPLFIYSDETNFEYAVNNKVELVAESADSVVPSTVYYDKNKKQVNDFAELLAMRTDRFCDMPKITEHRHFSVLFRSMTFADARDFWRHRMLTPSAVTIHFDKPCRPTMFAHNLFSPADEAALEFEFKQLWQSMDYSSMPESTRCYVLPMCTRVSFSWSINLRSLVGILELRTTSNTHHNVREVAQRIARQLQMPFIFPYTKGVFIDFTTYELGRLESERRLAEKQRKAAMLL